MSWEELKVQIEKGKRLTFRFSAGAEMPLPMRRVSPYIVIHLQALYIQKHTLSGANYNVGCSLYSLRICTGTLI